MPLNKDIEITEPIIVSFDAPESKTFFVTVYNLGKRNIIVKKIASDRQLVTPLDFSGDEVIEASSDRMFSFEAIYQPDVDWAEVKLRFNFNNNTQITRTVNLVYDIVKPNLIAAIPAKKEKPAKKFIFGPNDNWIEEFCDKYQEPVEITDKLVIQFDRSFSDQICEIAVRNNSDKSFKLKCVKINLETVTLLGYDKGQVRTDIRPKSELVLRLSASHVMEKRFDQARVEFRIGKRSIIRNVSLFYRHKGPVIEKSLYELPPELADLILVQYMSRKPNLKLANQLEQWVPAVNENYAEHFHNLLYLEELNLCAEFKIKYDQKKAFFGDQSYRKEKNTTIREKYEHGVYDLTVNEVFEMRPSLQVYDKLQVRKNSSPNIVYEGVIIALKEKDLILVQFRDDFVKTFDYSDYSVKFLTNRQTFIREHFALDLAIDIYGLDFLLPKEKSVREKPLSEVELNGDMEMKCEKTGKLVEWINPKLNEYQKQTVSNALRADFLNPFLIFGPPGTGKTTTLCEIILQILKNVENSNIIITTQSNNTANVIAKRLLQSGLTNCNNLLRLLSYSYALKDRPDLKDIEEVAKTVDELIPGDDVSFYERIEKVKTFRVVIGTSSCISMLLEAYSIRNYFTHAVVDEAGQCTEFGVLIPMCLVGRGGQVIMAGDPMQMPPLIFDRFANTRGLSISMFSRLLDSYRDFEVWVDSSNEYDPRLVTKLRYNYRSLPSILDYYNKQFYNSELIPCVKDRGSREASTLDFLRNVFPSDERNAGFGMFFINVEGKNERRQHSWYNIAEVKTIKGIVESFLLLGVNENSIGLITPYAMQSRALEKCFENLPEMKVGTVDDFQGLERQVIIISTVRTCTEAADVDVQRKLGFIKCPKRINVAVSRARVMVIVVGRKKVLLMDENWKALIDLCSAHATALTL